VEEWYAILSVGDELDELLEVVIWDMVDGV
jgi:hypothetical protein